MSAEITNSNDHRWLTEARKELSDQEIVLLNKQMNLHGKSLIVAYFLLCTVSSLGVHCFYIGRLRRGVLYIALAFYLAVGWLLLIAWMGRQELTAIGLVLYVICFGVYNFLFFTDLFTLYYQLKAREEKVARKLTQEIKSSKL